MGAVKDLMMTIEDSVWEAMERGAKTKEDVYSYVYANVGNVSREYVYVLVEAANEWPDDELAMRVELKEATDASKDAGC